MESHSHPAHESLLDALPAKVRDDLLANGRRRAYRAGDVLVRQGESALNLFIVLEGRARIEVEGAGAVGSFGPGDFFGEIALLEKTSRTATVIAEDGLTCLLIPAWDFRALLDQHPRMAIPMLHKLIDRLHGH